MPGAKLLPLATKYPTCYVQIWGQVVHSEEKSAFKFPTQLFYYEEKEHNCAILREGLIVDFKGKVGL